MIKRLLFFILLFVPLFAFGVEDRVLRDSSTEWRILVTDLIHSSTQEDASYICKTLSNAIYRRLSVLKKHKMSYEEIEATRQKLRDEFVGECQKALSADYKSYDELLFKEKDVKAKTTLKNTISKDERILKKAQKKKLEKIWVQNEKDIVFMNDDEETNTYLKSPVDLPVRAKKDDIDYVVWGNMKLVENVIIADISLYSRLLKKDLATVRVSGDLDSIYTHLDKGLDGFNSYILGRPWAKINVDVNSQDADVFVDGKFVSSGNLDSIIIEPGEHTVVAAGNNMSEDVRKVDMEEGDVIDLNFAIEPVQTKLFAVSSFPSGADVYYNSVWVGKTPMILNGEKGEVVVSLDGYKNSKLFLDEEKGNYIDFYPQKDVFDRDDYLLSKRKDFYKNLTWFVLSIPVAFFSYANYLAYEDLENRANATGDAREARHAERIKTYSQFGYYGAIFLSVTLFANAMFHLADYINAGQSHYDNGR